MADKLRCIIHCLKRQQILIDSDVRAAAPRRQFAYIIFCNIFKAVYPNLSSVKKAEKCYGPGNADSAEHQWRTQVSWRLGQVITMVTHNRIMNFKNITIIYCISLQSAEHFNFVEC